MFLLNYNPDKDEDFTVYYNSYQNKDYKGTGVLFPVCEEVGEAEQELLKLIKDQENVKYELIEYLTDVNREYAEVLVEQNLNGKTDTTYTYGADRTSKELFDCESYTGYYLYVPRGSVTGLTNWKGQLCKTYQYDSYGELTRGKEQYENAYTYNGESYNPNIDTLYLRARYYSVVTANFLTEDSYLGKINEPLTLNRYSYCLASPLNYVDPSGHSSDFIDYQELSSAFMDLLGELTGDDSYHDLAEVTRENKEQQDYIERSTSTGFMTSIVKQLVVQPLILIEKSIYQTDGIGRKVQKIMDNFPHIKVSFVIEGKNLNLKKLTEELDILPTETREIEDWPEAVKSNLSLPEELQPRCIWCICQEVDLCKQIETPIGRIIAQIKGKEEKLLDFCIKDNLKKSLCISIHAETMNLPEIVLPPDIVSYFGKLEAEIGFDIYTY